LSHCFAVASRSGAGVGAGSANAYLCRCSILVLVSSGMTPLAFEVGLSGDGGTGSPVGVHGHWQKNLRLSSCRAATRAFSMMAVTAGRVRYSMSRISSAKSRAVVSGLDISFSFFLSLLAPWLPASGSLPCHRHPEWPPRYRTNARTIVHVLSLHDSMHSDNRAEIPQG